MTKKDLSNSKIHIRSTFPKDISVNVFLDQGCYLSIGGFQTTDPITEGR